MVGYIEAVVGVGMIMGPVIGSILYHFNGYSFTFYSFGSIFFVFALIVNVIFPKKIDLLGKDIET